MPLDNFPNTLMFEGESFSDGQTATLDVDPNTTHRAVTRRALLRRAGVVSAAAVVADLLGTGRVPLARAATGPVLPLSSFGARGDGATDDTAAIQRALNAAGPGTTVLGQAGAVYVVTSTLVFPRDGVTLDLGGGSIRIGRTRVSGSYLQSNDTMFYLAGRNSVRITNGTILTSLSRYSAGGLAYRIQLSGGQNCQIDHLTAACEGSLFVYLYGQGHTIGYNTIDNGAISGLATTNVTVQGNTITNSPSNAIGFTGYQGAPVTGTQYLNNTISGYGRVAIEEYSPSGAEYCISPTFQGNTISGPSASNTSGTGISAICNKATIRNNKITDAMGWAIEATGLGTTVAGNQIGWSSVNKTSLGATAIVINTSLASYTDSVSVSGNTITGGGLGIQLYGGTFYCPVTIESNQLTNITSQGIALAPGAQGVVVQANNNVLNYNQPPQPGTTRYGIIAANGVVLNGNQLLYTTSSYGGAVYDIAYDFTANNVTMTSNLADGGGRRDPYVASGDLWGAWTGWTLTNNRFINGAPGYVGGLAAPVLSGNVGLS
jgi:hypothetical protein